MKWLIMTLALVATGRGQELTLEQLQKAMAADLEAFDTVTIAADGKAAKLDIKLGESPLKIGDEVFDGFRFECPELPEETDFVWYFNAPANWGNWYILPVKAKPGEAFKGWLDADKVYSPFDVAGQKDRLRVLQTLAGDYFKAGEEYVIWFRKTVDGPRQDLRGTVAFVEGEDDWDHPAIEKALGLKIAAAEDQVAELSSRGGMILLDDGFFTRRYAEGRIDSAFFSIRSTKRMSGGFFITTQIAVPPCDTDPSLAAIVAKHGPPDFTRNGAELDKVRKHAGGSPLDDDEKDTTRHYYDYFAFEVNSADKDPVVRRVVTHGNNFASLKAPEKGASYATVDLENLTVFLRDGEEVGRAYYFLEDTKEPIFITEPPAGEYRAGNSLLTAKGDGEWLWELHFKEGSPARRFHLEEHRLAGKAEGFHPNGKPAFTARYHQGALDGEVVRFDEAGEELSRGMFKDGEPVEEP